jgi:uncharacterized membrane protein
MNTTGMCVLLAQSSAGVGRAVVWILILLVAVIILGVVLMRLRKAFFGESDRTVGSGLGLDELRRMRDLGDLTDDEYRRAVEVIADRAKASGASPDRAGPRT